MFKKLQNLLFEEDDDEIEEDELEVAQKPVQDIIEETPVEAVEPVVSAQPDKPMQRIDMTQPIETVKEVVESVPEEKKEVPQLESAFKEETPVVKPVSFGITLDEKKPKVEEVEEKPVKAVPVRKAKVEAPVQQTTAYQFKPVISPIFGVDEKDLTAVKNTARKYNNAEKLKNDSNVTPVLSPIYGSNEVDSPSTIQDTVEKSEMMEKTVGNVKHFKAEDDIPEFSLDDILLVRDNEYNNEKDAVDSEVPELFDDETKVFDKRQFPSDEGLD